MLRIVLAGVLVVIGIVLAGLNGWFNYGSMMYWVSALIILLGITSYFFPALRAFVGRRYTRSSRFKQYSQLYRRIEKKIKLSPNIYDTAWYLAASEESITDTFAQFNRVTLANMPSNIAVYHVQGALIWHVKSSHKAERAHFLSWLTHIRAKQPLNGMLLLNDAFSLIQRAQKAKQAHIADVKAQLESLYLLTGYKIPLHLFLCGVNKLDGIAESLHEQRDLSELSFFLKGNNQNLSGELSQAYDELFKRLFTSNVHQVSLQLDEDFKRKQLLGPMQLQYLKLAVSGFVDELLDFNGLAVPFQLESFHLVESETATQRVNLATAHALIEINQTLLPVVQESNLKPKAQLTKTFAAYVLPSSHGAPANHWQMWKHGIKQAAMIFVGTAILTLASWVGWQAYLYNEVLHSEFRQVHRDYKDNLDKSAFNIDEPSSIIEPLTLLRTAYVKFNQAQSSQPWYVLGIFTSIERAEHYQTLYKSQLLLAIEPSLKKYLEEELFVYLELEDYLKVINVKDVYLSFSKRENKQIVLNYVAMSLLESGVMDEVQTGDFIALLNDFYDLGYQGVDTNDELLAIVDSQLALQDTNQLMYKYVKQLPEFTRLIDIRKALLGDELKNTILFEIQGEQSSFLVPALYTPEAMQKLSFLPESVFMQRLVEKNHGLFQVPPSERELTRIGNYLKYSYINDYTRFWRQYYQRIELKKSLTLEDVMTALTANEKSPLMLLYSTLRNYLLIPKVDVPKENSVVDVTQQAPARVAVKVAKAGKLAQIASAKLDKHKQLEIAQSREHNEISEKIQQSFSQYQLLIGEQATMRDEYQVFLQQLIALKKWMSQADDDVIPGLTYFNQIQQNSNFDAFSGLWLKPYSERLMQGLADLTVAQTTQHVRTKVQTYLQSRWQNSVLQPYNDSIAPYYPFAANGEDLSLNALALFFASDSSVSKFESEVLSRFLAVDEQYRMAIFNRKTVISLNDNVVTFFKLFKRMQRQLYGQGEQLQAKVTLQPLSLSPKLNSFTFNSGDTNMLYTHGPLVATSSMWPKDFSTERIQVTLLDLNNQPQIKEYRGVWGLLRLVSENQVASNKDTLMFAYQKEAGATVTIRGVDSIQSLLNPLFYSQLTVPLHFSQPLK
ncbi:type VI secretion protein IcmF/TssM N-terminal domain-containing protein [Pseudoalteromonas aurantia]|uniref:Type VI secretion system protein ImpL n=1 Tax=Pseudoalteromonas aurantia 208 TaxID=1314867 RepID=A0ABR9EFV3_9GAMM|nr:type VI secretion protein IcmF/TssM N-terminal domain-containing protein [Pseudoalteromonas aurantia]MBE0369632.1 type VI secretion system protein ImpL [Pseudoalteromonas aurantia 208]